MANTFMIEVRFNGRPLYANVYVHTTGQLIYHVNFIGEGLPDFLRDTILLHYEGEQLKAMNDGIPNVFMRRIIEAINKQLG